MKKKAIVVLAALALAGSFTACGGGAEHEPLPASDVPEHFHLTAPPPGARPVADVLASAQSGDEVVVVGRVGGAERVFVDGFAAFTLVDPGVQPCGVGKMDDCPTPWDYCCDPPEVMAKSTLSVELVDGKSPLRASARGFHGLDHLSTVVVQGELVRDGEGNARVLARGIHVKS